MTPLICESLSPCQTVWLLDSTAKECSAKGSFYVTGDYAIGEDYPQSPWETGLFPSAAAAWNAALIHLTDRNI